MNTGQASPAVYIYKPEALARLQQRRKRVMAPVAIMMLTLVLTSALVLVAPLSRSLQFMFATVSIASIAVAYMALATTRTIMERTYRTWSGYKLIVDEEGIERIQNDMPVFRLRFSEIRKIELTPGVGIRLNPGNPLRSIFVPEAVEGYTGLRRIIEEKTSAVLTSRRWIWLWPILGAVLGGAAISSVFLGIDPRWVLPLASLTIALLVWLFVLIQRNPNFSRSMRVTSWAYIGLAILCAYRIYRLHMWM